MESLTKLADPATLTTILTGFLERYEEDPMDSEQIMKDLVTSLALQQKQVFMTLRLAVTGFEKSPPLSELVPVMGVERVRKRLNDTLGRLRKA